MTEVKAEGLARDPSRQSFLKCAPAATFAALVDLGPTRQRGSASRFLIVAQFSERRTNRERRSVVKIFQRQVNLPREEAFFRSTPLIVWDVCCVP
jgi:hypothetical protein